ncbi:MAG: hypothetical protein JST11_28900 [Acidobacteria bacterium]|nr:hypothetical protein [Acidobacteriota bacterium]
MINPVSSSTSLYVTGQAQSSQSRPAAKAQSDTPQDTVQLSAAAKAALGDADHDGDSR